MKKIIYPILILIIFLTITTYNNSEKKELEKIINYEIYNLEEYTPNSYENYINALNEAIDTNNKIFASKTEINNAINNLENKINNLDLKPDKTTLKNKYIDASSIKTDLYIENSTTELNNAIENAKNIINDENALLKDVDNAITMIDNAINLLIIKPDKTTLNNLINNSNAIKEDQYTTDSYNIFKENLQKATLTLHNKNATQQDVDNSIISLNKSINDLKIATKAIFQINIYTYMLSNNHVGNEWYSYITYNNKEFKNGSTITAKMNSTININTTIVEDDKIPDSSTSYVTLTLKDNYEKKENINVRENRGRYYGNIAVWEIKYSVKLIKKIN